jgi:hypothetical protein
MLDGRIRTSGYGAEGKYSDFMYVVSRMSHDI